LWSATQAILRWQKAGTGGVPGAGQTTENDGLPHRAAQPRPKAPGRVPAWQAESPLHKKVAAAGE
jgi:hypothetical protein